VAKLMCRSMLFSEWEIHCRRIGRCADLLFYKQCSSWTSSDIIYYQLHASVSNIWLSWRPI